MPTHPEFRFIGLSGKQKYKGYYKSFFEKRDGKKVCVRDMNVKVEPAKAEG